MRSCGVHADDPQQKASWQAVSAAVIQSHTPCQHAGPKQRLSKPRIRHPCTHLPCFAPELLAVTLHAAAHMLKMRRRR